MCSQLPSATLPTRSLALVKGCVPQARLLVRRSGHSTLARAAFDALRSHRQVSMLERGTICGYRRQRLTAGQKTRFLKGGIDQWPIQDVAYRLLYLKIMMSIEAFSTLICKKVKRLEATIVIGNV